MRTGCAFSGGSADTRLWPAGLTAPTALAPSQTGAERYPFALEVKINGSEAVSFLPLGGETIGEGHRRDGHRPER